MPRRAAEAGPSQRQLRVAEEVRHALAAVLARGELRDPALADARVTVTEVRASPDLKHMTAFVSGLGRPLPDPQLRALRRAGPHLRAQVARAVQLKFAPELHFQSDTAPDYALSIDLALRQPAVARDLTPPPAAVEEG